MGKENYFRKIIIIINSNSNKVNIFNKLPNWSYQGTVRYDGTSTYDVLEHKTKNVKVLLKQLDSNNPNLLCSQNVLPSDNKTPLAITDCNDTQEEDIRNTILFELCKELNKQSDICCGIVPADND